MQLLPSMHLPAVSSCQSPDGAQGNCQLTMEFGNWRAPFWGRSWLVYARWCNSMSWASNEFWCEHVTHFWPMRCGMRGLSLGLLGNVVPDDKRLMGSKNCCCRHLATSPRVKLTHQAGPRETQRIRTKHPPNPWYSAPETHTPLDFSLHMRAIMYASLGQIFCSMPPKTTQQSQDETPGKRASFIPLVSTGEAS